MSKNCSIIKIYFADRDFLFIISLAVYLSLLVLILFALEIFERYDVLNVNENLHKILHDAGLKTFNVKSLSEPM